MPGGSFSSWLLSPPPSANDDIPANQVQSQDVLGRGPIRPFSRSTTDVSTASGAALVKSAIGQILGTRAGSDTAQGELPWRPDFGSQLYLLRHGNHSRAMNSLAQVYVQDALSQWEPRADVTDTDVEFQERTTGGYALVVRVRYRLIAENVTGNRVEIRDEVKLELAV